MPAIKDPRGNLSHATSRAGRLTASVSLPKMSTPCYILLHSHLCHCGERRWPVSPGVAVSATKPTVASRSSPNRSPSIVGSSSKTSGARSPTPRCSPRSDCSPPTNASKLSGACRKSGLKSRLGDFPFVLEREDVHMHIEAALIENLGDVGRKLHTARSRNDQVATDLKLWVREALDRIDARLVGLAAGLGGGRRAAPRRDPARLHAHAAGAAGAGAALLPGLCREARARPIAAGRLPPAAERPAAGRRGPGRHQPADRSRHRGRGAGLRGGGGQQPGCLERPRLRPRVGLRPDDDRRAPLRLGRGVDPLVHPGVRLPGAAGCDLHRQQHHAAEEEPRRAGADPRPDGPGDRRP